MYVLEECRIYIGGPEPIPAFEQKWVKVVYCRSDFLLLVKGRQAHKVKLCQTWRYNTDIVVCSPNNSNSHPNWIILAIHIDLSHA